MDVATPPLEHIIFDKPAGAAVADWADAAGRSRIFVLASATLERETSLGKHTSTTHHNLISGDVVVRDYVCGGSR